MHSDATRYAHPEGLTARDILIACVMNIMWGLNLIAVKMGVDLVSPLTAAWLRQAMVLAICLPALKIIPGKMRELLLLGVLSGALFYIFVNLSLAVSDNVSALAIAGQLGVPFSLIMAILFLGEKIHGPRMIGIGLAFGGVVMLVFDPAAAHEQMGMALTAASCLIWAFCSLIQRRLIGTPVLTIYAWVGLMGTTILFPIALYFEPESFSGVADIPLSTFGWILFSALGSTVVGQGAMSFLLQRHPVSSVIPLSLVSPVIAVVASSLYFGTKLTSLMIIGGVIVMMGVAIVTIRTAKAKEAEQRS
ncbi:MAG: EamA family transporter [Sphingomonadales bacterium]|nr:EamA family transporter [Sphingomonadales bacterium]